MQQMRRIKILNQELVKNFHLKRYVWPIGFIGMIICLACCQQDPLKKIPTEEKKQLECLFQDLFLNQHLAYTLLGDKPVSLAGHFYITPMGNLHPASNSFKREWEIWEKYQNQFKFKNHLLTQLPNPYFKNSRSITLINKNAFIKIVNENLDLFQKKLGKNLTGESLLNQVEKSSNHLFQIIKKDEALYGILLGYGRSNSLLFQRYAEICLLIEPLELTEFSLKWPKPHPEFSSLKEEFDFLQSKLGFEGANLDILSGAPPVYFRGIPDHEETIFLRQKYEAQRKKIVQFYSEGKVFDKTVQYLQKN